MILHAKSRTPNYRSSLAAQAGNPVFTNGVDRRRGLHKRHGVLDAPLTRGMTTQRLRRFAPHDIPPVSD
jgi:hypothetical protein